MAKVEKADQDCKIQGIVSLVGDGRDIAEMHRSGLKDMQSVETPAHCEFGQRLVDSTAISDSTLDTLFAALLLTAGGAFICGNLLLLNPSVFQRSAQITLACLAILLVFYALARTIGSVTWGLIVAYSLVWVMTYSRQPWLITLAYVCGAFGLLFAIRFLRVSRRQWGLVLLMAVIGTATALASPRIYTSFDMLQRLQAGDIHQDTLFHASISAMIKNYGVVSTGLHGLVETPYHTLSHVLMAGISQLSGTGTIEVYGVAGPVLFIPILIFSVVACCAILDQTKQLSLPILWSLVCILLVGCPLLFSPWVLVDSYFVSESYLVSLGLFLLGLPLLFKTRLVALDLLLVLLLAALIANTKGSVGLIFAGLWLMRLVLVQRERHIFELIAALAAVVAVVMVTLDSAGAASGSITVSPFHFIRTYSFGGPWLSEVGSALLAEGGVSWRSLGLASMATLSFFVLHFLLSWIVLGQAAYTRGMTALLTAPAAIYSLATVAFSAAIILTLSIGGGSAYYFSNIAFFVALPFVAAFATHKVTHWKVTSMATLLVGIVLVVVPSLTAYHMQSALWPARSVGQQISFIDSLVWMRDNLPLDVAIQPDPAMLENNPVARCTARPFVFPAVSERPWVDVVEIRDDCTYQNYGYSHYGIAESQQRVTAKPQLLPGMALRHYLPTANDTESKGWLLEE